MAGVRGLEVVGVTGLERGLGLTVTRKVRGHQGLAGPARRDGCFKKRSLPASEQKPGCARGQLRRPAPWLPWRLDPSMCLRYGGREE